MTADIEAAKDLPYGQPETESSKVCIYTQNKTEKI